jgi:hypothetical protein
MASFDLSSSLIEESGDSECDADDISTTSGVDGVGGVERADIDVGEGGNGVRGHIGEGDPARDDTGWAIKRATNASSCTTESEYAETSGGVRPSSMSWGKVDALESDVVEIVWIVVLALWLVSAELNEGPSIEKVGLGAGAGAGDVDGAGEGIGETDGQEWN